MNVLNPTIEPTPEQRTVLDKVMWRVMPLVTICMAICTIDRSNIGFAKLQMVGDLGMTEAVFALGSSLFYLGYIALEIPSALAAHRYGGRLWFARIAFTWGLATLALAFTNSGAMFYVLRFLLGAAEAGLYPGLLFYITLWFPKTHHAKAMGLLTIGSALGNGVGALVSGPLLDLRGVLGLAGWQWIFLVTGSLPIILVAFILRYMRDGIGQAEFLTEAEKAQLAENISPKDAVPHRFSDVLKAVASPKVFGHGVAYTALLTALYGVIYWSPSVVKTFGVTGTQNGLLVALPWALDIVLLCLIPPLLRDKTAVLKALMCLMLLGSAAFAAAAVVESSLFRYATLLVGIPCISIGLGLYWTFPATLFRGAPAAAALAAISTFGNMGGLVGQNLMPALAKAGGSTSAALVAPCVLMGLVAVGALATLARGRGSDGRAPRPALAE